jgi:hypothetical protein
VQCREKFYSLRRSYRNYLKESSKTGNRRPKPFAFETEMELILKDDTAFKPKVLRSSFETTEINNNVASDHEDDDDEDGSNDFEKSPSTATPSTSQATTLTGSKKRKRVTHTDELRAYLAERDEKCLTVIQEMQEKQNKLMEKLIEKL